MDVGGGGQPLVLYGSVCVRGGAPMMWMVGLKLRVYADNYAPQYSPVY